MRSEASHPGPHQTCVPAPCLRSPRKRRHDCFSLTALERKCRILPKPVADSCSCDHKSTTAAGDQRPLLLQEASRGRRPQRPGNQLALARSVWKFTPRQSAFENHRLPPACRNHPASSGTLTFRWSQSRPVRLTWQRKKLAALCRTCGRSEFPVDKRGKLRINPHEEGQNEQSFPTASTGRNFSLDAGST
jgi:hypothetical protein